MGTRFALHLLKEGLLGFHSINVPSEWGPVKTSNKIRTLLVSIQLMSPASGDLGMETKRKIHSRFICVSIQLMSPASGDPISALSFQEAEVVSIQLMSPASGD